MSTPTVAIENLPVNGSHHVVNGWSFTRRATISNIPWGTGPYGGAWPDGLLITPLSYPQGEGIYTGDSASLLSYAMWYLMAATDVNSGGGIIGGVGNSYTMPPVQWQAGSPWLSSTPINIPATGSPPPYGTNVGPVVVYIEQFVLNGINENTVKIDIMYKGYPALLLEMDSSLTGDTTNEDVFGNVIQLAFTYPSPWFPNPINAGKRIVQSATYQRQLPQTAFTFKFSVTSGYGGQTAWDEATWFSQLEGCINSNTYTIGTITCLPHQLLCTKVAAQSKDGGTFYEITMSFLYKPDPSGRPQQGWDKFLVFTDPNLGVPPPGIASGTSGIAFIQQYPAVVFPTIVAYPI